MNWIHPPKREAADGINASINLDMIIGVVVEEVFVGSTEGDAISAKTETRITFLAADEYSFYWSFDDTDNLEKALALLKRANAWK